MRVLLCIIGLLLATLPATADSIDTCIGEPVRFVQPHGALPVAVDGLSTEYPDAWATHQHLVRDTQPVSRVLYWTDTAIRTGWIYEDDDALYLFIFQPKSEHNPITGVWHGACFLQLTE